MTREARKLSNINRSHLAALTGIPTAQTRSPTRRDQRTEELEFSRVNDAFRSKPFTVYRMHFKVLQGNDASPAVIM